jgi:hypothetical protein
LESLSAGVFSEGIPALKKMFEFNHANLETEATRNAFRWRNSHADFSRLPRLFRGGASGQEKTHLWNFPDE